MQGYQKFCYWIDLSKWREIRTKFEEKGTPLPGEFRIPCRVLRRSMEIACVTPSAWDGFCNRRTSWYGTSEKAGKFLIVSRVALHLSGFEDPIRITESDFRPGRFPGSEEISQLIQSGEYREKKPSTWDKPGPIEQDFYQKWFGRHRRDELFDFDRMLMIHSANHANFLSPKFFVIQNGTMAPYSISNRSIDLCSSCLEFFNVLGGQWPIKYVVPCIGAVQFACLPMDQYFGVETPEQMGAYTIA